MYDLIGDIHGHADELVELLERLGYRKQAGVYGHAHRQVVFLGDFIDRGPKILHVLNIVRPMIDQGAALAVMGNHEWNALAYHTRDPDCRDECLRPRSEKNNAQHRRTLEQLTAGELASCLQWFRSLPLWLDLKGLRVVHACWDPAAVRIVEPTLKREGGITPAVLFEGSKRGRALFAAVETLLKGKEAVLPGTTSFADKDGVVRTEIRTRWYLPPEGHTYASYAMQSDLIACDVPLTPDVIDQAAAYPADAKPVFVGHYWLWGDRPTALAHNVACLDYSVAKGGLLCAYRFQGEQQLNNEHFVWVAKQSSVIRSAAANKVQLP